MTKLWSLCVLITLPGRLAAQSPDPASDSQCNGERAFERDVHPSYARTEGQAQGAAAH